MAEETEQGVQVKVNFRIPQKLPSVVAHEMLIQPSMDGITLCFFEVQPLISSKATDDEIKMLQESGVVAECVSKVFVPMTRFQEFVTAMNETLHNVQQLKKQVQDQFLKQQAGNKKNAKSK